jgi:hypothetical protein
MGLAAPPRDGRSRDPHANCVKGVLEAEAGALFLGHTTKFTLWGEVRPHFDTLDAATPPSIA